MRHFSLVAFSLLLALSIPSSGQTRRDEEPYCDDTSKRVEIADADATILGLTIGYSSLKDVQAKLGAAETARVSHEEESDISVCYTSPIDHTVVVFYSGAMGGWKDMTRFAIWSPEAAYPHASQCASSELVSKSLATASGLRLGLTKKELEKIAGPTKVGSASAKYEYLCRRQMTPEEIAGFKDANNWDVTKDPYFDRMSWIDVRYANSAASRLEIGRIDSY